MERIVNNINIKLNPLFGFFRKRKLNNIDFTIISNNCWGGVCYEYFNLKKNTPTVGLYFFPDDYIKFVKDLRYYLSLDIEMITSKESKYYNQLLKKGEEESPVGRLDDVEVVFLHYKDPCVARDKWERRRKRVNYNNIIIKFSYMNGCTDEHIHQFEKINGIKKFALVPYEFPEYDDCIVASYAVNNGQITNDTFYFNKDINVIELINKEKTAYNYS